MDSPSSLTAVSPAPHSDPCRSHLRRILWRWVEIFGRRLGKCALPPRWAGGAALSVATGGLAAPFVSSVIAGAIVGGGSAAAAVSQDREPTYSITVTAPLSGRAPEQRPANPVPPAAAPAQTPAAAADVPAAAAPMRQAASSSPGSDRDILNEYAPSNAASFRAKGGADRTRVAKYRDSIMAAAREHNIPAPIIAGVMSRESRAGNALDANHCGDGGRAFGLMQIDKITSGVQPRGEWNSSEHISQATGMLAANLRAVSKAHPQWSEAEKLRGAVAAYNFGVKNVLTVDNMDFKTTHNNYSADVWARAIELAPIFDQKPIKSQL